MKPGIGERLRRGTLLLDGGMGSSLIARGLGPGVPPERWNLDRPDEVLDVHRAFLDAGSQVVQTNTFGANALALAAHGLADQAEWINVEAARLACEAVHAAESPLEHYVAGDIGPSGRFLAPVGDVEPAELEHAFAVQAAALAEGGVDYLAIETMVDLAEALCALRAAQRATSLPVTVCLTFERNPRGGFFTIMGNPLRDALCALADAGAAAVGANCSIGSDAMLEACPQMLDAVRLPVIVKPNAGLPELEGGRAVYRQPPAEFGRDLARCAQLGAAAVGGCCGADPAFIAALAAALRESAGAAPAGE